MTEWAFVEREERVEGSFGMAVVTGERAEALQRFGRRHFPLEPERLLVQRVVEFLADELPNRAVPVFGHNVIADGSAPVPRESEVRRLLEEISNPPRHYLLRSWWTAKCANARLRIHHELHSIGLRP